MSEERKPHSEPNELGTWYDRVKFPPSHREALRRIEKLEEQLEIERQERADFEAAQARLLEQLEAARAALEFYADEKTWTQPTSWGGRIIDDEGPWLSDTGKRAREALNPAKRPSE